MLLHQMTCIGKIFGLWVVALLILVGIPEREKTDWLVLEPLTCEDEG